jgi:hypothetical protein
MGLFDRAKEYAGFGEETQASQPQSEQAQGEDFGSNALVSEQVGANPEETEKDESGSILGALASSANEMDKAYNPVRWMTDSAGEAVAEQGSGLSQGAGEWLEWGIESYVAPTASESDQEFVPPSAPDPEAVFEVTDPKAFLREAGTYKNIGKKVPAGVFVKVLAVEGRYAQIATLEGAAFSLSESDNLWTSKGNLSTKPEFREPQTPEVETPAMEEAVESEDGTYLSTFSDWMVSRQAAAADQGLRLAGWLTGAEQDEEVEAPQEAEEDVLVAPEGATYPTPYVIAGIGAMPADSKGQIEKGGAMLQPGLKVWLMEAKGAMVRIQTLDGQSLSIDGKDNVWVDSGAIGGFGNSEITLANDLSSAKDAEASASAIEQTLPEGRNPGQSPYGWKLKSGFQLAQDGQSLDSSLLTKVQHLCEWAVANDMVTGDIHWSSGMRSPRKAHKWCVAWNIQHGEKVTFEDVKKLTNGRDEDQNVWYEEGWTWQDVQDNAKSVRSSSAIAAAGWPGGHSKRAPLPDTTRPGVSRHCTGGAIDVTIPWRAKGKPATSNAKDVWGWEEIYRMFGLERTLPKGHKHEECWHLQETKDILGDDEGYLDQ